MFLGKPSVDRGGADCVMAFALKFLTACCMSKSKTRERSATPQNLQLDQPKLLHFHSTQLERPSQHLRIRIHPIPTLSVDKVSHSEWVVNFSPILPARILALRQCI